MRAAEAPTVKPLVVVAAVLLLVGLVLPTPAEAWSGVGHRLTARIAYRNLTPEAREQVDRLLRHHPTFVEDLIDTMPADYGDSATWAFMEASVWPDVVRNRNHRLNSRYGRAPWHYITLWFVPEGQDLEKLNLPEPPSFRWQPGQEADNAVTGIMQSVHEMGDPSLSWDERAVALSFFLHMAGDIHQPLHAVSRFSEQFPDGDRGANEIMVRYGERPLNLHAFWDQLPGRFAGPRALETMTLDLEDRFPRASLPQRTNVDFGLWATESHELGISVAHRNGEVRGVTRSIYNEDRSVELPTLEEDYVQEARRVAEERVVLAGYRMAAVLNAVFGDPTLELPPFVELQTPAEVEPGTELLGE